MSDLARLLAEDARARAHALDVARSFVVQAPAGAGKTELLTQRVLALLAHVDEPEEILAITFTKKAAGEMRERILRALGEAADPTAPEPKEPHKQLTRRLARAAWVRAEARDWSLRQHPARLQVQTIDAFNMALVRQLPVLARFGVTPGIAEEPGPLYAAAARSTLARLGREDPLAPACATLLNHMDGDVGQAVQLLADMLVKRDQWLPVIGGPRTVDRARLDAMLHAEVNHQLAQVSTALAALPAGLQAELIALADGAGRRLAAVDSTSEITRLADLKVLPVPDAAVLPVWRGLAELVLTAEGKYRKRLDKNGGFPPEAKAEKARMEHLIGVLRDGHPALAESLGGVRALPDGRYDDRQWAVVDALVPLLNQAVAELKVVFAEHGQVDYAEVAEGALRAVGEEGEPTDLGLALDARLKHVLIDEFQDTAVAQYQLLRRLTADWQPGDGRTLFAVGDPMQSIYRFRKAEVGLFLRACQGRIGTLPVEHLVLHLNTRSTPALVAWFNEVFPAILPAQADEASGKVPYNESSALDSLSPLGERVGVRGNSVHIRPLINASHEEEAERVAELIARERAADPDARIAVLVAGRAHLEGLIPKLRQMKLGYRAVEIESLADRPVVQDLVSLARALVHPGDRTAWLAVLRAPWCGLALGDLLALAGEDAEATVPELLDPLSPLGERVRERGLSKDANLRLTRIAPLLISALDHPRGTLAERVAGLWHALGGPAAIQEPRDLEDARVFLNLLAEIEAEPEGFEVARLEHRLHKLWASIDPASDERLQLMTIHAAKGLEFDVVIVPGLGREPRAEKKQLLQWIERPRDTADDVLFGPVRAAEAEEDRLYKFIARLHSERAEHERGRLFYVACTRAKRTLHLVGSLKMKGESSSSHPLSSLGERARVRGIDEAPKPALSTPPASSLLHTARHVLLDHFEQAARALPVGASVSSRSSDDEEPTKTDLTRLTRDWHAPTPPTAVPPAPLEARPAAEEGPVYEWAGETARHVGTVVHRLLMHIAETGLANYVDEQGNLVGGALAPTLLASARIMLQRLGVPEVEQPDALARVKKAIENTLSDEMGRWVLTDHLEARSEYAVSGMVEGKLVHARIDRTFIVGGVRWVVDFKTSAHSGGGVENFVENERQRYQAQIGRCQSLVPERKITSLLYFSSLGFGLKSDE